MKTYWILLIQLSVASWTHAQTTTYSYDPKGFYYHSESYKGDYEDYQNQNSAPEKSTPSQDASKQNTQLSNTQKTSGQETKSTPSQDTTKVTNQDKQKSEVKEEKKQESEKKEEKKEEEKKDEKKEEKKEEAKPKSPHTFTGSASFVSDYRFRGISQTMRRPAVQAGFEYSHVNGIYLGTWGSNVDGTTNFYNNTSLEWDFYGGYKNKLLPCWLKDMTYNMGLIYYYYPGGQAKVPKNVKYNTCEYYIGFAYKGLEFKMWQSLTDYFGVNQDNPPTNWKKNRTVRPNGSSRGSINVELSITFELWQKIRWRCLQGGKFYLFALVGHQTVKNYEQLSCTHWRVTLTQEFDWFNVFITYVGTNARHAFFDVPDNSFHPHKRHLGAQGFVIGVIRPF